MNPPDYVAALKALYPDTDARIPLEDYNHRTRARVVRALDYLRDETFRCQTEHGFDATPGEDIALIHSEASEALEDLRAARWNTSYDEKLKPLGVASELADILIRICAFAEKHRLDLAEMVVRKMLYNETRPFKHGGKAL